MSAIDLKTLTSKVLSGSATAFDELFRSVGADSPSIHLNPTEAGVDSTRLRSLFSYWGSLPHGERLPLTEAIDALAIGPALGIVMLLETTDDPHEFRYRLYGSEIASISKRELTGKTTAAIPSPEIRAFFQVTYAASVLLGQPLLCNHRPPPVHGYTCWSRLILPCEDGSGRVNRLLVGNEPALPSLVRQRPWPDA